jgi:hypothetical protein
LVGFMGFLTGHGVDAVFGRFSPRRSSRALRPEILYYICSR